MEFFEQYLLLVSQVALDGFLHLYILYSKSDKTIFLYLDLATVNYACEYGEKENSATLKGSQGNLSLTYVLQLIRCSCSVSAPVPH